MTTKKNIGIIVRVLIGLVFIASSVTKYISIEAFDIFIYEHQLFPWVITTFVTRLLIAIEGCLGVLLVLGVYSKIIKKIVIGFLAFFTIYVILKPFLFNVDTTNCHCFGTVLILSDTQTLIKNIVLLILSYFMFWDKGNCFINKQWQTYSTIVLSIFALICVFLITKPDVFRHKRIAEIDQAKFDYLLSTKEMRALKVTEGRKIVCMFSTGCKYCKRTAMRLEVIKQRNNLADSSFAIVFWGNPKSVDKFFNQTKIERLPHTLVSPILFLRATKGRQPIIIIMNNGKIVELLKYPNINEKEITNFINNNNE